MVVAIEAPVRKILTRQFEFDRRESIENKRNGCRFENLKLVLIPERCSRYQLPDTRYNKWNADEADFHDLRG
jgi:hypothetical protein